MTSRRPANEGRGILSVWNDVGPETADLYERWYMGQHFPERLGVPGFLRGRRYVAIAADRKYFTFYDLDSPDVLFTEAYLARLNTPTTWTATVMRSWSGMLRTVCERVRRKGDAIGGFALVARWESAAEMPLDLADRVLAGLDDPGIVAVDHWRATDVQNEPSKEMETRREADRTITAALVVEATDAASLERAATTLPKLLGRVASPAAIGTYRLIALQDAA